MGPCRRQLEKRGATYCSAECQRAHRPTHKIDCATPTDELPQSARTGDDDMRVRGAAANHSSLLAPSSMHVIGVATQAG